jgi:hypothetical protein
VIVFRHADARVPFLWETDDQPPARWHGAGEGPVAYLAETPDGAWAEFLRHEEITDAADLEGVDRAIWAIDLPDPPTAAPRLPVATLTGDRSSWPSCQAAARRLRARGEPGLAVPSAALVTGTPSGSAPRAAYAPRRPAASGHSSSSVRTPNSWAGAPALRGGHGRTCCHASGSRTDASSPMPRSTCCIVT